MKNINHLLVASLFAFVAAACGDDDGPATIDAAATIDGPATIDANLTPDAGPPPKPTPGARIDRMGRPAINTALNHTFDTNTGTKGAAKDAYNAAATADWQSFVAEFRVNQGILDSLDSTCGNALAADLVPGQRYAGIAGVLADDQLYVNTGSTMCGIYLAVEANATGLIPNANCGGRSLDADVIMTSYSVLATPNIAGVDDGIPANDLAFQTTFPYLAAPH